MRNAEWILSLASAAWCVIIALMFVEEREPPFTPPNIYMLEIAMAGVFSAVATAKLDAPSKPWGAVPWLVSGILLAFVILGILTIGPLLVPAMLAVLLSGFLSDLRLRRASILHVVMFIAAGGVQAGIIWSNFKGLW